MSRDCGSRRGCITICTHNTLDCFFFWQARGQDVPGETLHEILNEIDLNLNGQVEFDEYLQVIINLFFNQPYFSVEKCMRNL